MKQKLINLTIALFAFTVFGEYAEAGEERVSVEEFGQSMVVGDWTPESLEGLYSPWKFTDGEKDLLARIMYSEAAGEGDIGMNYVLQVVLNRIQSEEFPSTVEEVVLQKTPDGEHQFSSLDDDFFWDVEPSDICYEIISDVEVEYKDWTNGALYFCETSHNNTWHKTKQFLFAYKNHEFYK